jgi:hypothetical protein
LFYCNLSLSCFERFSHLWFPVNLSLSCFERFFHACFTVICLYHVLKGFFYLCFTVICLCHVLKGFSFLLYCMFSLFSDTGLCEPEPNECHLFPLKTRGAVTGHQLIQNSLFLEQLIEQNEVAMANNNFTSNSRHGTR